MKNEHDKTIFFTNRTLIDWGTTKIGNNEVGRFIRIGDNVEITTKLTDLYDNPLPINMDIRAFRRLKQFENPHKGNGFEFESNGNGHGPNTLTVEQEKLVVDFYDTYFKRVRKFYMNRGFASGEDLHDLTADFFQSLIPIIANKEDHRYPRTNVKSWVFQSARNFGISYLRKEVRLRDTLVKYGNQPDITETLDENFGEAFSQINHTVPGLVLWLRLSGLTNKEVAYVLGMKKNALKTNLSRAVGKMREFYRTELLEAA